MSNRLKPRKSWQEKLADSKGLPKVETITDNMCMLLCDQRMEG